ncbi:MAG: DinB family protein [Gemmatimonadetes bacterium]|nr:DinB family protein [Gemmatimonadota bacterium]
MTTNAFPTDLTPAQLLYPDMEAEFASTRRMLERVPEGSDDFKPHAKSMSLKALATHIAELPTFGKLIVNTAEFDFGTGKWETPTIGSNAERLAFFEKNAAEMKSAVEGADWAALAVEWTLRAGEQIYVKDKKSSLLRTMTFSHIAHHRAQLGVYLRELDLAIPGMYGPSADEM